MINITTISENKNKKIKKTGASVSKSEDSRKFVPDTSAIINGVVSKLILEKKIRGELIIPEFVIAELENQANRGREIGFDGLDELKNIRGLCEKNRIKVSEMGRKPTIEEIQLAKSGRIDALIKDIARDNKATLITADIVQAKSADAVDVRVLYFKRKDIKTLKIEKMFTSLTSSIHLKEGAVPKAKIGKPGKVKLVEIDKKITTKEELEDISKEIMDIVRVSDDAMVEIGARGATIVQYGQYRIAITRQPFSEKMEVTVVRPIAKVDIDSYRMSAKLKERLDTRAEGIVIAGLPGGGKSTLAQAFAEYYQKKGKIVKTMEQPRDLQVGADITQYGALGGDMAKTADIMLLVRPDFTVYDELRRTNDFRIFADMRLAGVGMLGVVHATEAIDAVHRFIGRIELGLIPQVIDTIIFVKDGEIRKVYTLSLGVRVPTGMSEADLARPVIDVSDFETEKLVYEIYTYGEQTVVIPVKDEEQSSVNKLAGERIREILGKYIHNPIVEVVSGNRAILRVAKEDISYVIGKNGTRISELEKTVGMHISVEPILDTLKHEIGYKVFESGGYISVSVQKARVGSNVDIYKGEDYLFSATVGKKAIIKVKKKSELGIKVLQASALQNLRVLVG
ncbi:MAG: PINc/VapC family ATPase [archaeon]|nr:PINc/VapC family ATPase [archaeon]